MGVTVISRSKVVIVAVMALAAFGITPIQGAGKAEKSLPEKSERIQFPSNETTARVIFIADTHAVDDARTGTFNGMSILLGA